MVGKTIFVISKAQFISKLPHQLQIILHSSRNREESKLVCDKTNAVTFVRVYMVFRCCFPLNCWGKRFLEFLYQWLQREFGGKVTPRMIFPQQFKGKQYINIRWTLTNVTAFVLSHTSSLSSLSVFECNVICIWWRSFEMNC